MKDWYYDYLNIILRLLIRHSGTWQFVLISVINGIITIIYCEQFIFKNGSYRNETKI